MKTLIVIYVLMMSLCLHSTIINIPADYSTIQAGINASADTDTVLVQPGTYVENIDFNGHLITLGSLFLTTADDSYISQTVIDGGAYGSVVKFQSGEDSTTVITGFTIQNGWANDDITQWAGGGIKCVNSSPIIRNNIIKENVADQGSGILCYNNSNALITENSIHYNIRANEWGNPGGGIYALNSDVTISNNRIYSNESEDGGGIAVYGGSALIKNNLIYNNLGEHLGGAIRCDGADVDMINNTIYGNAAAEGGALYLFVCPDIVITNCIFQNNMTGWYDDEISNDASTLSINYTNIEGDWAGIGNIYEDPLFINPVYGDFHLQANSPCIDAGDPNSPLDPDGSIADMGALYYVQDGFGSVEGIVTNSETGIPIQDAFVTLGANQTTTTTDDTGYYIFEDTFAGDRMISVNIENYLSTSAEITIIPDETVVQDFSMEVNYYNITSYSFILEDSPDQQGYPNNNPYTNSYNDLGWTELIIDDNFIVTGLEFNLNWNNLIHSDEGELQIISPSGTQVDIYHPTQTGFEALELETNAFNGEQANGSWIINIYAYYGFGGYQVTDAELILYSVSYMTVEDVVVEYESSTTANVTWTAPDPFNGRSLDGYNIYLDGELSGTSTSNDFTISGLTINQEYTVGVSVQYSDEESEIIEIDYTHISTHSLEGIIPVTKLIGNYPNPFNPTTQVKFSIKDDCSVQLLVYNIKGQLVKTLLDEKLDAGLHQVVWEGIDNAGKHVSSGVYFYKIKAGRYTSTKKMILMK